jgi:hypothetical protein
MNANAKKTTTTTNNAFSDLLRTYENATRHRNENAETEKAYTTALQDLATACTFSVLKKLCNVGGTVTEQTKSTTDTAKTIRQLRQSLAKDLHDLNRLAYASANATAQEYNADGDLITVIKDKDLHKALTDLCAECFGDGLDLMHTAVATILTETAKATDLTANFMEIPYNVRRLKRKVYIQSVDSLGGYETVQTTAIQEVYKAIRREIESNRTMQVASNKYTYLESIATDTESDTETEVFRRLTRYSGLAYEQTDISGKVTAITADSETVRTTDELIAQMNLTTKQAKVLQLRQSGYGYKAIATYLGVTQRAVAKTVQAIQTKALAIGLTPTK